MTTTTPPDRPPTRTPALPIRPRPLWEFSRLFLEPDLPESPDATEDEEETEDRW